MIININPATLVLASTSPFRRELLQRLGVAFKTMSPDIDESPLANESPEQLVQRLSEGKARKCGETLQHSLVIGSDQVAVCNGKILGKPGNHLNACAQLAHLSGNRVSFLTGICLFNTNTDICRTDLEVYHVTFRKLTAEQIDRYLESERPYNCAGSFKSEALGISLFEKMEGNDPTALIGLPLIKLTGWLNDARISVP